MARGWLPVSRKMFDGNDLLWESPEPFDRRSAWIDLLQRARRKPGRVVVGRHVVHLERGQVWDTERGLAERWRWSRAKVRRFLLVIGGSDRVVLKPALGQAQAGTIITIVNYDAYNEWRTSKRPTAQPNAAQTRPYKKKDVRKKEEKQSSGGKRRGRETWLTPYADAWTEAYGGEPVFGALASNLKPLIDKHGDIATLTRWKRYIASTEGQFASPARFSSTFGEWGGEHVDIEDLALLLDKAGVFLHDATHRTTAFEYLEKAHPDVWSRAGPTFCKLRFQPLIDLRARRDHNGVRRELEQQCRGLSNGRAA